MGGGVGVGFGLRFYGCGRGLIGAYLARRRAKQQLLTAVEADLSERGLRYRPRRCRRKRSSRSDLPAACNGVF
jgi:hypothetical protein